MSISSKQMRSTNSRPYTMRRRAEQVDADAPSHHRGRDPAAYDSRPVEYLDRGRRRRSRCDPPDRLSALRRPRRAVRGVHGALDATNPPPDAIDWRTIPDLETRARVAFGELYAWYRDHGDELHPIYSRCGRDAPADPDRDESRGRGAHGRATRGDRRGGGCATVITGRCRASAQPVDLEVARRRTGTQS